MRHCKFTEAGNPIILGVAKEPTVERTIEVIKRQEAVGVSAFDLHLSLLEGENREAKSIRKICEAAETPILAVHYNYAPGAPGAKSHDTDEMRYAEMLRAIREGGCAGMDLQAYSFCPHPQESLRDADPDRYPFAAKLPREVVLDPVAIEKQKRAIDEVHKAGGEVLMSCHTKVNLNSEELVALVRLMAEREPDIVKLVIPVESKEQVITLFDSVLTLNKSFSFPVHLHASGKLGRVTRYVAPYFGAKIAFVTDHANPHADREQLIPDEFFTFYNGIRVDE